MRASTSTTRAYAASSTRSPPASSRPTRPACSNRFATSLLADNERYFHLADLIPYADAQEHAAALWAQPRAWARKALLTISRMGPFSSDRTVAEYADEIWGIRPCV